MRLRQAIHVSDIPDPGALMGQVGSTALIDNINRSLGTTSFFDTMRDVYSNVRNIFIRDIVTPMKQMEQTVTQFSQSLLNPDTIRPLTTLEDFQCIPPRMMESIALYPPVTALIRDGRISGFGYDGEALSQAEDVYGRLIQNGTIEDVQQAATENNDAPGWAAFEYDFWGHDPDLSFDELEALESTRRFVDWILAETPHDPTDIGSDRS